MQPGLQLRQARQAGSLESKAGPACTGDADALILTFAQKVMPKPALPERWWARSLLYEWAGDDVWMRDSWLAYGEVSYCKNCPFVSERRRLSGRDPVTVANDHTIHHEYNILRNVGGVVANPS